MDTAVLVAARSLQFLSALILVGTPLFFFYGLPPEAGAVEARATQALRLVLLVSAALLFVSAFAWVGTSLVALGDDAGVLADPETLSQYFFGTSFGRIWALRLCMATVLLMVVFLQREKLPAANKSSALVASLAAIMLVSQAWIGHPASLPAPERWLVIAAYVAHVIASAIWIGALVALACLLGGALRGGRESRQLAIHALWRFSPWGIAAVALILSGGIVNAISRAHSLDAFVNSGWGRIVMLKTLVVSFMIALASYNRFVLLPRLPKQHEVVTRDLARTIAMEQAFACIILFASAFLSVFHPPMMTGMTH